MNKKGFTLIELLAVIIILSIILVIAIPNVLRLIKESKLSALGSSAKIIARKAEDDYTQKKIKNRTYNPTSIPCTDIVNKTEDYGTCTIIYDSEGTATVSLIGAVNRKFDNMFCSGTIDAMHCDELGKDS